MMVRKRSGAMSGMSFDKILNRIRKIGTEVGIDMNYSAIAIKVIDQLYDGIETSKIDELTGEQCATMSAHHPNFNIIASRVVVSNHQKNTAASFSGGIEKMHNTVDMHGNSRPMIADNVANFVADNSVALDSMIVADRDYLIDYFGFKTLERAYLFKINDVIVERPQHMWMRVAVGIHAMTPGKTLCGLLSLIRETYDMMSLKYFTHATPTIFNAGTPKSQLSSCYLIAMESDSLDGIYSTLTDCAMISKWAGGIGLHIHDIRAKGSHIHGTNGKSNGLVPMLRVFNNTARYVDQGGGKRNGSFAIYLEPWHADVVDFLELKKNHGDEELKARDLFYGLWVPDLFMERIKANLNWSLMCPNVCPGLSDVHGPKFVELYEKYESDGKYLMQINARELWFKILDSQMETGTPYLLYKDTANKKSNQQNLGTIKSSNLCCEIIEFSSSEETAVCNLASIGLPTFVDKTTKMFDYDKLHSVVKTITNNLNRVIDVNYYPTDKTRVSNMRHRPIGIGVQGLADTFALMDVAFVSEDAATINKLIFETIYHAALTKSNEISIERHHAITSATDIWGSGGCGGGGEWMNEYEKSAFFGDSLDNNEDHRRQICGAYSSFEGSPTSQGMFQFDLWEVTPSDRYDWPSLRESVVKYGIRNSLLVAPMPTASTSQILGFNECFEPFTSNMYTRRTLAGEFIVVNKYLMNELVDLNIWSVDIKNSIIERKGSIQHLDVIPERIREKYRIVWEIPMKTVIDMSVARGAFICQSQSLNLWLETPSYNSMTSMHFYAWKHGLKTGMYYLRRKAAHHAQQFTIEPKNSGASSSSSSSLEQQSLEQPSLEPCESCSA